MNDYVGKHGILLDRSGKNGLYRRLLYQDILVPLLFYNFEILLNYVVVCIDPLIHLNQDNSWQAEMTNEIIVLE